MIIICDVEYLQPCSHEEADTRILLHVAHCARQGLQKVVIRTVDTDVVVLAIGHFLALRLDELWVSFGVGTHFRQIAIHEIVKSVNEKALMFFHAISGCDTVSSFLGRGKKSAWLAWSSFPSVRYAFLDLSMQPTCVNSDTLEKIERFIVIMYSRTCSASGVNGARKELFAQGSRTMENIPPTKAALLQHVRRAACTKQGMCGHMRLSGSPSCLVLHFGGGSHLIRGGNPSGLNYQRRPLHATNLYTADARRAAGASANAVHRIYNAQNSANVVEHVVTTCSS